MTLTQLALTITICYILVTIAHKAITGKIRGRSSDDLEEIHRDTGSSEWEPEAADYTLRRSMRNFKPKYPERDYKWYSFRLMRQRTYDKMKAELEWLTEEVNLTESQLCKKYADDWAGIYAEAVQGRERAEAEKTRLQRVVDDQKELIDTLRNRIRNQDEKINVLRDEASGLYRTSNPLKAESKKSEFSIVKPVEEDEAEELEDAEENVSAEPEEDEVESQKDETEILMDYLEISTQTELKQAVAYWMQRSGKDEKLIAEKIGCKSIRQYVAKGKKIIERKNVSMAREHDNIIQCINLSEIDTDTLQWNEYCICYDDDYLAVSLLSQLSA